MTTNTCGSEGVFSRAAFSVAVGEVIGSFDAGSPSFQLGTSGVTIAKSDAHINTGGLDGTLSEVGEFTRSGLQSSAGDINLELSPETMNLFGPFLAGEDWGDTTAGSVTPVRAQLPRFHCLVDKDAMVFPYYSNIINQMTISSKPGEMVTMVLGCLGKLAAAPLADTAYPSGIAIDLVPSYAFHDLTVEIDSTEVCTEGFTLQFNNNHAVKHICSTEPCGFKRQGKISTMLTLQLPQTAANIASYLVGKTPPEGFSVTLTFTHPTSGMSTVFTLPMWQPPRVDSAAANGEIVIPLAGPCRRNATDDYPEYTIFNDNVPD